MFKFSVYRKSTKKCLQNGNFFLPRVRRAIRSGMIIRLLRNFTWRCNKSETIFSVPIKWSSCILQAKPWTYSLKLSPWITSSRKALSSRGTGLFKRDEITLQNNPTISQSFKQMFDLCRGLDFENFVDRYLVSSLHSRLAKYLVYKIYLRKFWSVLKLLEEGLKPTTRFVSWFQRTHGMYSSPEIERTCCGRSSDSRVQYTMGYFKKKSRQRVKNTAFRVVFLRKDRQRPVTLGLRILKRAIWYDKVPV